MQTIKTKGIITHTNIISKWDMKLVKANSNFIVKNYNFNAEINVKEQTIRIFGFYNREHKMNPETKKYEPVSIHFDMSFRVGSIVEYGSYNLQYLGTITKLSANTVEVNMNGTHPHINNVEIKRLKLWEFIDRNWDFDLERITKSNLETSQTI